ncbi:hypothetical protein BJ878DRAFT_192964 [Calycina marina]|uniref:Dynamin stalk domain-containing protein n=1 Tax=Calycina marina TaxID=1763456 RepID=A0A9P8CE79_9HELO|nr:hypothetical protein BJ878DRAFT_192964 [Calycina marina]
MTIEQRHEMEERFFQTSPWNWLPKNRVAVGFLKTFLVSLLHKHIKGELPGLQKADLTKIDLDSMGMSSEKRRMFSKSFATLRKTKNKNYHCCVGDCIH